MNIVFLKLGGSLITDKTRPYSPRPEKLDLIGREIASAIRKDSELHLILGHGSGSFGHTAATKFNTRQGVSGRTAWHGFAEVWFQASKLNRIVIEALHNAGLPAITFSPAASITSNGGKIMKWDHSPILTALNHGLVPVIHGDVVFDESLGGTILSTEDLFSHLVHYIRPQRILLAGLEAGVWADFPENTHLIPEITSKNFSQYASGFGEAKGADVTGGMLAKVTEMLSLIDQFPDLEVLIFSGELQGNLSKALEGNNPGTLLHC